MYVSPPNSGRVSFGGLPQSRNPAIKAFPRGTDVVVEAMPVFGYRFGNWSGDIEGNDRAFNVRIDNTKTVTANFYRIIPNWLIAIIVVGIAAPLLLRWRRRRLKYLTQTGPQDSGAL